LMLTEILSMMASSCVTNRWGKRTLPFFEVIFEGGCVLCPASMSSPHLHFHRVILLILITTASTCCLRPAVRESHVSPHSVNS
jgi:hypothetical protein